MSNSLNTSQKYSPEVLSIISQLVSRKSAENARLKEELEELKKALEISKSQESAQSLLYQSRVDESEKKVVDANAEKHELRNQIDRLKTDQAKRTSDLKEARNRTNKILTELNKLKSDLTDKYILKTTHKQMMKESKDFIHSLQAEIELFRREYHDNVSLKETMFE